MNLSNIYEMNMWLLTLPIFLWSLLAASSWKCFHSSNCKGDALRACKTVHAWRHTTVPASYPEKKCHRSSAGIQPLHHLPSRSKNSGENLKAKSA